VLFVAGDGVTRAFVGGWLEMYGYAATTACDGEEAAALLESDRTFGVLIVEAERGGAMDGLAVASIARDLNPDIGVLYTARAPHALQKSAMVRDALCLRLPHRPEQMLALLERLKQPSGSKREAHA
jgi:DNA-binding NtrC family response regulator